MPNGYLLCDVSAVSRTTYASLFAAIGTAWGIGEGSTTFNLPDVRETFLRSVDNCAGNDPVTGSRTPNPNATAAGGNTGNSGDAFGSITSSVASLTVIPPLVGSPLHNANGSVTLSFDGLPNASTRIWATTKLASPFD